MMLPFLFLSSLASLCGGVSMPLTEVHAGTILPQKVRASPSMALQRKESAKKMHFKKKGGGQTWQLVNEEKQ